MRRILAGAALVALAGCAGSSNKPQEVHVTVTEDGFVPPIVTVAKGSTATLVITRRTDATCATMAVFAESGQKFPLPLNQDVRIPITTTTAETLHYACSMDMYKGQVAIK